MDLTKKIHYEDFRHNPDWQFPEVVYGENLISEATNTNEKYAVVSMEIPWDLVKDRVVKQPEKVVFVPNMHIETMDAIVKEIPDDLQMVIGIGGGSSHDCAKYIALKKNLRLIQMPTIFGGDSVVCSAIGVRMEGRVKYIGHTVTDKIYVDYQLIRKAPSNLIRYGAADILSSYTALLDWKLASEKGLEKYDKASMEFAKNELLDRLKNNAGEIKCLTDKGIKCIVELFLEYARLANKIDTDRAQEGSEHFFCYNAEYVTKRTYVHGALLSLGIWVSASFFHNRKDDIEAILNSLGLEYNLKSAGLTEDEFTNTLLSLKKFIEKGGYYYSVINEMNIDESIVKKILASMKNTNKN